ncbi:MAG: hypothetical protein K2W78_16515 [Xanthobacteraceae bacterium]|nr:hypothetical protein [Xanthobacteraceae bacterium]
MHRLLIALLAVAGLSWGIATLPKSESLDDLRDFEAILLHNEEFSANALARRLESTETKSLSGCDTHSQNALSLAEMRLTQAALLSGNTKTFTDRANAIEARLRLVLSCAPHHSFSWLMAFALDVLHGRINDHSFQLLAMSYATSPNEAWIAIRRNPLAVRLFEAAPDALRPPILREFQLLVINGFSKDAASGYRGANEKTQALLRARIEELKPKEQDSFRDALDQLRS